VNRVRRWHCLELPVVDYAEAWDLQQRLVEARMSGVLDRDIILVLEHLPVFTLGRRGGKEYLTVSERFLERKGIPLFHIERGGYITFHGPGQLVVYPILDLSQAGLGVADYVTRLEDVMVRLCADWGVTAGRNPKSRGVWVGNKKLGSVGIAIRRGVSFHGFALNVSVSLEPFTWVHPCGLKDVHVTSIKKERGESISMNRVRRSVRSHMESVFGVAQDLQIWKNNILKNLPG